MTVGTLPFCHRVTRQKRPHCHIRMPKKMGNCTLISVEGRHTVYIDDSETVSNIIEEFIAGI